MRYLALAIILLSIPVLIALLGRNTHRRDLAVLAIGILLFCTGPLSPSAALISWPTWQGLSKGIILSLIDTLGLALIITRPVAFGRVPFKSLFGIFAGSVLLSLFQAPVRTAAFFVVFQLMQLGLFYVALASELRRSSAMAHMLKGLAIGLMLQAAYVIDQKLSGVVQAPGTMAHQNILGMIVELSALTLAGAVLEGARSKVIYAGLCAAGIVLAGGGSRGAMLYSALGLAFVLAVSLIRHPTPRKGQVLGVCVAAAFLVVPLATFTLRERFGGSPVTAEEEQRSAFERAARMIARDHPWGVGANNFVSINNTRGYADEAGLDWSPATRSKPAHNAYLLARAETGWVGEIALILFLGGLFVAGLQTAFRDRKNAYTGLSLGSAGAIAASALHSNYEYAILTLETERFVFLNAAVIAAVLMSIKGQRRKHMSSATTTGPSTLSRG